jgi:hypothetical protein
LPWASTRLRFKQTYAEIEFAHWMNEQPAEAVFPWPVGVEKLSFYERIIRPTF